MTSLFLYTYTKLQCKLELSKKWKMSTNWTHTKKGVLWCTVSQSAIPCEQPENPVDTNTFSYPLSPGSHPKYLHIKRNVIPHKCTSRSCQTLNKMSNQSCQVSSQMISQSVQVAVLKKHMETQCYYVEFSKYKGMSKEICNDKYWENFINFLEKHNQLKDFMSLTLGLQSGRIDPNNLSLMSALHIGRYSNCPAPLVCNRTEAQWNFTSYIIYCLDPVP